MIKLPTYSTVHRCFRSVGLTWSLVIGFGISATFAVPAAAQVRSYDGTGNNLSSPDFGAAGQAFTRLAPSDYSDGISAPGGVGRANAREISNTVSQQPSETPSQRGLTNMVWQWGQFIDHDFALTEGTNESLFVPVATPDPLSPGISLNRSDFDSSTGVTTPRQQVNSATSFLDASMVYGTSLERANALRTMSGGRMNTSSGDLLPFNTGLLHNANDSGLFPDNQLFVAGDVRSNEQPGLTAMHTLFVREHNRLADEIAAAQPTWTDEEIYQHARRTVSGIVQSITYNEFLPSIIGDSTPTITQYDPNVDATLSNEFATAAFRFGHTMVTDHLIKPTDSGTEVIELADGFFNPTLFTQSTDVDQILDGLQQQTQNETDLKVVEDLRSMLFGPPGSGGLDLVTLNIERGREHGLASYSEVASLFGLDPVTSFADVTSDADLALQLASVYQDAGDIDLWVGLLAADREAGTEFGVLLNSIVADQFSRLMEGDRFFFAWDEGLTEFERQQIMDTRLSDVIARNTSLTSVRANVFVQAIPEPSSLALLGLSGLALLGRRRK